MDIHLGSAYNKPAMTGENGGGTVHMLRCTALQHGKSDIKVEMIEPQSPP